MTTMIKKLNKAEKYIGGILFLFIVLLACLQVLMRYVLKMSVGWIEEWTMFLFVWFVYFGVSACVEEDKHLRVEFFASKLPETAQRILNILVDILWLCFCYFIFITSSQVFQLYFRQKTRTVAARIPYWIEVLSVTAGMILMALRVIQHIYRLTRQGKEEAA